MNTFIYFYNEKSNSMVNTLTGMYFLRFLLTLYICNTLSFADVKSVSEPHIPFLDRPLLPLLCSTHKLFVCLLTASQTISKFIIGFDFELCKKWKAEVRAYNCNSGALTFMYIVTLLEVLVSSQVFRFLLTTGSTIPDFLYISSLLVWDCPNFFLIFQE